MQFGNMFCGNLSVIRMSKLQKLWYSAYKHLYLTKASSCGGQDSTLLGKAISYRRRNQKQKEKGNLPIQQQQHCSKKKKERKKRKRARADAYCSTAAHPLHGEVKALPRQRSFSSPKSQPLFVRPDRLPFPPTSTQMFNVEKHTHLSWVSHEQTTECD